MPAYYLNFTLSIEPTISDFEASSINDEDKNIDDSLLNDFLDYILSDTNRDNRCQIRQNEFFFEMVNDTKTHIWDLLNDRYTEYLEYYFQRKNLTLKFEFFVVEIFKYSSGFYLRDNSECARILDWVREHQLNIAIRCAVCSQGHHTVCTSEAEH